MPHNCKYDGGKSTYLRKLIRIQVSLTIVTDNFDLSGSLFHPVRLFAFTVFSVVSSCCLLLSDNFVSVLYKDGASWQILLVPYASGFN